MITRWLEWGKLGEMVTLFSTGQEIYFNVQDKCDNYETHDDNVLAMYGYFRSLEQIHIFCVWMDS